MSGVAVVTGAGSGIGRAVAAAFLAQGWRVALAGRREQPLNDTRGEVGEAQAIVVPTDVTRPTDVDALFESTIEAWGRVDLLFNNAGVFGPSTPFHELDPDAWRTVIDTNLTGSFLCARAAFRAMRSQDPQGGRIINNGSISAHVPRPRTAPYAASKHAITGLTRAISLEGRPFRIACGQIDVGNAATELAAGIQAGALQANGAIVPEPMMDAADVAACVLQMAALPLEANVQFITVMATNMPYIGRG